jgi:DNA-binding GntR family transcriptional regulator
MARPASATDSSGQLLAERAYVELRDRIVKLQIEPGAPIDEDSLGQQLAMGRTPVREAIKRLVLENLVVVFPRRGTFAADINITDLTHISDVRGQLEGHAAYLAAQRLTEPQLAELQQLRSDLAVIQGNEGTDALMELDARVHRFIYACAANPYLEATLDGYFNLSRRIWYLVLDRLPDLPARVDEHDEALAAIAAGDGERARSVLAAHVATFEREIRAVL